MPIRFVPDRYMEKYSELLTRFRRLLLSGSHLVERLRMESNLEDCNRYVHRDQPQLRSESIHSVFGDILSYFVKRGKWLYNGLGKLESNCLAKLDELPLRIWKLCVIFAFAIELISSKESNGWVGKQIFQLPKRTGTFLIYFRIERRLLEMVSFCRDFESTAECGHNVLGIRIEERIWDLRKFLICERWWRWRWEDFWPAIF